MTRYSVWHGKERRRLENKRRGGQKKKKKGSLVVYSSEWFLAPVTEGRGLLVQNNGQPWRCGRVSKAKPHETQTRGFSSVEDSGNLVSCDAFNLNFKGTVQAKLKILFSCSVLEGFFFFFKAMCLYRGQDQDKIIYRLWCEQFHIKT